MRTPTQHREEVARWSETAPARDSDISRVLAWPTLERLASSNDERGLRALVAWRDLMEPPQDVTGLDYGEGRGAEAVLELRPTENEMLRCVMRPRVTRRRHENGTWSEPERNMTSDGGPVMSGEFVIQGDLRFRMSASNDDFEGLLVEWRDGADRPRKPVERYRRQAGAGAPSASMKLPDGTRLPLNNHAALAEAEQHRRLEARAARNRLGERNAEVLDLAVTDAPAREVGEALGYRGKYAERVGVKVIREALAAFAQNDNEEKLSDAA